MILPVQLIPFEDLKPLMCILANSEDPDEMPHNYPLIADYDLTVWNFMAIPLV